MGELAEQANAATVYAVNWLAHLEVGLGYADDAASGGYREDDLANACNDSERARRNLTDALRLLDEIDKAAGPRPDRASCGHERTRTVNARSCATEPAAGANAT